jgi:ElaB/YqjD/DUF883 family membrane-anchored ribosome-binding protein
MNTQRTGDDVMATYSTSPSDLRENGAAAAERIKEKVGRTAETVKESAREGADRVRAEASHALDSYRDRVSERPLTSLAVGVGIGLLAGFLFHRR